MAVDPLSGAAFLNPALAGPLVLASGALSVIGQLGAAQARAEEAKLRAFNLETEKIMAKAQGIQSARLRNEAFKEAKAINDTIFLSKSDELTTSQEAFYKGQKEKTGDDVSNINLMTFMNQLKYTQEVSAEKRKGRTSLLAGVLSAGITAFDTHSKYQDVT
jgi:hypothetical protein